MHLSLCPVSIFFFSYFLSLPYPTRAASLLEDGDDFSNNLVSDLAPLLALFGERVTTQFMSQSTGWADCIALAMAPIGVITIMVSAIRVAGPRLLKAVIGRARENIATVELEVMSSTSPEACELWNSQTRAVVRCPGTTDNCEFVCIYPKSMQDSKVRIQDLQVQVMDIEKAIALNDPELSTDGTQPYLQNMGSKRPMTESPLPPINPNTIIITRNPKNKAPNMTLNCTADGDYWQVRACAAIGIVIQAGVLVFFGFLNGYRTLKFEKDGTPVQSYAMPVAVIGTLAVNLGILICAHAVDESSTEETYGAIDKNSTAVALVWLQKEKNVSDQHFDSAAIYPTITRHQACTSRRRDDKEQIQLPIMGRTTSSKTLWLEAMATSGTLITLMGFFAQFIGLRGMHWLASIAQLGAIIIMTILRAFIRRHLASGLSSDDLKVFSGFELEWFVASLLDNDGIPWIPGNGIPGGRKTESQENEDAWEKQEKKSSNFKWVLRTGEADGCEKLSACDETQKATNWVYKEVSGLSSAQKILDLRRHLGELSEWHGPASKEALAVAQAIEKTMDFFDAACMFDMEDCITLSDERDVNLGLDDDVSVSTIDSNTGHFFDSNPQGSSNINSPHFNEHGDNHLSAPPVNIKRKTRTFNWNLGVEYSWDHQANRPRKQNSTVRITLKNSLTDGWSAPVDLIDAMLSLWLFSEKKHRIQDTPPAKFPSGNDQWARGGLVQEERALRMLGPLANPLLRDLEWWMPNGLDGVLQARARQSSDNPNDFPHCIKNERIGYSGERGNATNPLPQISVFDDRQERTTYWDWKPAENYSSLATNDEQTGHEKPLHHRLVTKTEDPLHILQAKDLFSAFLWTLASSIGNSAVSRKLQASLTPHGTRGSDSWKRFSLQNQRLSRLVQSIADLGLWTEREVWASLVPPLSATDNLPGLESLIQMVQENGAKQERNWEWDKAGDSYRWLFDIGSSSPPGSHIRVKSTAILWRFYQRVPNFNSPLFLGHDFLRETVLERELSKTQQMMDQQQQRDPDLQIKLESFFNLHHKLEHFKHRSRRDLGFLHSRIFLLFRSLPQLSDKMNINDESERDGDIFDRTYLHHAVQSNFIDHHLLPQGAFDLRGFRDQELAKDLKQYVKCIAKAVSVTRELQLYPLRLLHDLYSPIFFPIQTFQSLLENGADPNARDLDHLTPLHYACRAIGQHFACRFAGRHYLYLSGRQNKLVGLFDLRRYYKARDEERINVLLRNKADINAQDLQGNTPLHFAVSCGRLRPMQLLIEHECKVNISNLEGQTPLHVASSATDCPPCSSLEYAKPLYLLLKAKAEVNIQDEAGQTPLHLAIIARNIASVRLLVNNGAKHDVLNKRNRTPQMLAASLDFYQILQYLHDDASLVKSIFEAAKNGAVNAMDELMLKTKSGSWPLKDEQGQTPIYYATIKNTPDVVFRMIRRARDLEIMPHSVLSSKNQETALSIAASRGYLEIVNGLAQNLESEVWKALLEYPNSKGCTAVFSAVEYYNPEVFSFLLDHGANVRARENDGRNLLHYIVRSMDPETTKNYLQRILRLECASHLKSMAEETDKENRTPRYRFKYFDNEKSIKVLDEELDKLANDAVGKQEFQHIPDLSHGTGIRPPREAATPLLASTS